MHSLTHRMSVLWIWYCYVTSPLPTLVNVVHWRSEMIQPHLNIVFLGKGGSICSFQSALLTSSFSVELLSQVVNIEYRRTVALPFKILTKSPFH